MYIHHFTPIKRILPAPDVNSQICDRLRYYRRKKGLSQFEAAALIGIDRTTYIRWESQPLKYYPQDKLQKAAEVFGCDISEITDRYNRFLMNAPNNLKDLRRELRFTQRDLAHQIGVSVGTVKEWERGSKRPQRKSYEKLMILTQPK